MSGCKESASCLRVHIDNNAAAWIADNSRRGETTLFGREKLQAAAGGVTYVSESDAPFEAFEWPAGDLNPAAIPKAGGHSAKAPVAEVPLDTSFAPITTLQDWNGDEEKTQVAKCVGLRDALKSGLSDPKVFRVGKGDVTYYIVGRSKAGNLAGVKTTATET